jgi:hypothetical protein
MREKHPGITVMTTGWRGWHLFEFNDIPSIARIKACACGALYFSAQNMPYCQSPFRNARNWLNIASVGYDRMR